MVWLNLPLQRQVNCSLCYGQTMPSPMWEKWELRAKAAYSPCASWHSLGWKHLTASRAIQPVYSWLGTDKHGIKGKWSKLCCLAPWHSKSVNFSLGKLSPTWLTCANSSPNAPPKCLKDAICTWNCGKAVETAQFHELYCSLVHKGWNIQDWILGL